MERIELQAASRTIHGKQVKQLRADGWIPAVVFGPDRPSETIKIEQRALFKCLQQAGSTALIYLFVDNGPQPILALARDIQRDVLSGDLLHVDFYEVRLTEKVKTMPRIEIVGESPLAHSSAAVMVQAMNEVEVECLPTDLIHSIHVDVSGMDSLDKNILIRDLPVSVGVTILADPDDVVVSLVPVRMEKEEEAAAEEEGVMAFGAEPEPEEEE